MSVKVYYQCGICGLFEDNGIWSYIHKNLDDAEAVFEEAVAMADRCEKDRRCLLRRLQMLEDVYKAEGKEAEALLVHRRLRQVVEQMRHTSDIDLKDFLADVEAELAEA
ncbi:MAG: hypothetical protein JXR73_02955 [Candidatus Omnitrophica bacterium]|nr:hypothetical protein [Candidatus Omnitrophota bacterium]